MAQSKILLDTNSYFRLAKSIHPLLGRAFGKNKYALYVSEDVQKEFDRNPSLKNKFVWVSEAEYKINRQKKITLSNNQRTEYESARDFLVQLAKETIALEDINGIAYAQVLDIPLVTDDREMANLAKDLELKVYSTVELLKLMVSEKFIGMKKVREIAQYLKCIDDWPSKFDRDYKRVFKVKSPS
jgi:predicted nucleic acid-binding protein